MRLLEGGYASAEDIDVAVQKGLNWPMGPFHLLDFSGLDIFYGAMKDRHRQGEGEGRASPEARFHPDAAAMHFDDALGNGEAQAGAALLPGRGVVDLLKLLKDFLLIGGGDART